MNIIWLIGYLFFVGMLLSGDSKFKMKDIILYATGIILWPIFLGVIIGDYLDFFAKNEIRKMKENRLNAKN